MANTLFTLQSLGTFAGATGATFAVTNGLALAFGWSPKWLGLVVAEVICLAIVALSEGGGSDYFIAFLNGFLVFSAAAGVAGASSQAQATATARSGNLDYMTTASSATEGGEKPSNGFLRRWF